MRRSSTIRLLAFAAALQCGVVAAAQDGAKSTLVDVYARPVQKERAHDFDMLHYRIGLTLDPENRAFDGDTRVEFRARRTGVREIALDAETFTVQSVTTATGAPLKFTHEDGSLRVKLEKSLRKGEASAVVVAYSAVGAVVDAASFGFNPGADLGLVFQPAREGQPALVNTQSFPEGARHWFPAFDHPSDPATQETIVTAPASYEVISNGRLVSQTADAVAATRTFRWSQEKPHPTYLFVVTAGPYKAVESDPGDVAARYWVYPEDVESAKVAFANTQKILAFFAEAYGTPYPWAKYDQITVPTITGGAESTSATIIGDINMFDPGAYDDFSIDWLIAHEAAHQYWGDLVSYRDWEHIWIAESFATYAEVLYDEYALGAEAGALRLQQKHNDYLREAREKYIRPIVFNRWAYPNDVFDRHTYHKGAAVLHMLRELVGRETFGAMQKRFLEKHAYQPVTTQDFIAVANETAGEDLGWFFDQWLLRPGHPVFDVSYAWNDGAGTIALSVRQTQDETGGAPVFKTPVRIDVVTEDGSATFDALIDEREETFDLPASSKPLMVRFDVGDVIVKELQFTKGVDELAYQLVHDDIIGRAWAARELGGRDDAPGAAATLLASARRDAHWSVRKAAIGALPAPVAGDAAKVLRRIAADDAHPQVRAAAIDALRTARDKKTVSAIIRLYENDESYLVKAAAVRFFGAAGGPQMRARIESAKARPSPRNVVQRAADEALAQMAAP